MVSKTKLDLVEENFSQVKAKLPEYLAELGYDVRDGKKIKCINPEHNDKHPSMSMFVHDNGQPLIKCLSCIEENEYIWTNNGAKKIRDVSIGEHVLTIDGTYKPIISKTNSIRDISLLKSSSFFEPLKVTEDHIFFFIKKEEAYKKLPYITRSNNVDTLLNRLKNNKRCYRSHPNNHLEISQDIVSNLNIGDYLLFPQQKDRIPSNLEDINFNIIQPYKIGKKVSRIKTIQANINIAWLLGVWTAEGSIGLREVCFTFHINELESFAKKVKEILKSELNLESTIYLYPEKNTCKVICSKVDLVDHLRYWIGDNSNNKKIPSLIFSWPKDLQKAFIDGYLDGDGSKNHKYIQAHTVSRNLAYGLYRLSISCDLLPSISFTLGSIDKYNVRHQDFWTIGFKTKESLSGFYETINNTTYYISKIKNIDRNIIKNVNVVDIGVQDNPSFVTKLGAIHNCGFISDIFTAAHILEEKPIIGAGFLHENVKYLADKYSIEVNIGALTEEEIYEINTYDAYKATSEYINKSKYSAKCLNEITNRHWSESFLKEHLVSCCVDYHDLRSYLKSVGFSARFLDEVDLDNQKIFNQDNLIFTICDEYGRPVGFSGRNLNYDPNNEENGPKFTNTKTTGLKCNIFRKSERLYLLHIAKKHVSSASPLYIVEGYGDTLTLHLNGVRNAVGVSTADVNDKQLNALRRLGINDIVICLDGDIPGQKKAKQILDDVLKNVHDLRIRFVFLPWDGKTKVDPDQFVREKGIEEFLKLPKVEPFSWRLAEFIREIEEKNGKLTDSDSQLICQTMIPIIAAEPSPLKRETMIRELANYSGFSFNVIKEELEKILNAEALKIHKKKRSVIDNLIAGLQTRTDGYEIAIEKAVQDLEDVNKETRSDVFDSENIVSVINNIKQYQENEDLHRTINFGDNFNTFPVALAGDISQKLIFLGGSPNSGKSSIFSNMALNLPLCNEDITSVIMTIDDSNREFLARLVCYDMAKRLYERGDFDLFSCLNISKVAQPFLYKNTPEYEHLLQEREHSYRLITALVQDGRFGIFDATSGKSVSLMRNIVKKFKLKRPDTKLTLFLDNFHQLDSISETEGRHKFRELSGDIKSVAVNTDTTIIATVEYNKIPPGQKPSNNSISESAAMEYDSNAIMHLYNELHDIREKSRLYFEEFDMKYPIIEQMFAKNKISSFKGSIYYRFYADKSYYKEVSFDEITKIRELNNLDDIGFINPKDKTNITIPMGRSHE